MFQYIGGAVAIGLVIWMLNRFLSPRLDLNKQDDRIALWSLYAIVDEMDGPAEKLDTLVKVVREALGQPAMDEDHILEEYRLPRERSIEKARGLSWRLRVALLIWAYRIKCGDEPMDSEAIDGWMEEMARRLGLGEADVNALYETLEDLSQSDQERESLALLKKSRSRREQALGVLGLGFDATKEQIDKAFQKKRMAAHPDRERDPEKKKAAEAKLKEIQAAYKFLTGKRSPGRKK